MEGGGELAGGCVDGGVDRTLPDTTGYGQQAGSMHLTLMLSFLLFYALSVMFKFFNKIQNWREIALCLISCKLLTVKSKFNWLKLRNYI